MLRRGLDEAQVIKHMPCMCESLGMILGTVSVLPLEHYLV